MKALHYVAFILLAVGGINWGLVGLAGLVSPGSNWNVVNLIVTAINGGMQLEGIIYVLVGLSAVWIVLGHKRDCKMCSA